MCIHSFSVLNPSGVSGRFKPLFRQTRARVDVKSILVDSALSLKVVPNPCFYPAHTISARSITTHIWIEYVVRTVSALTCVSFFACICHTRRNSTITCVSRPALVLVINVYWILISLLIWLGRICTNSGLKLLLGAAWHHTDCVFHIVWFNCFFEIKIKSMGAMSRSSRRFLPVGWVDATWKSYLYGRMLDSLPNALWIAGVHQKSRQKRLTLHERSIHQ